MATAFAEAALVEDFIDFLEDECDLTEFIAREPDPVFRERLRRRLWQSLGFGLSAQGLDIH
jgi:hypothetical protein